MNEASDRDEHEREHEQRRRLERILPELIKRVLETGYEKLTEGPENVRQFVSELKLPKEALALLLAQLEESKNGLYRAVAREVRDFLDNTNLSEELVSALTKLSFEIRTEIRFVSNESRPGARPKPEVQSKVSLKRTPSTAPPPAEPGRVSEPAPAPSRSERPPTPSAEPHEGGAAPKDQEEKVE